MLYRILYSCDSDNFINLHFLRLQQRADWKLRNALFVLHLALFPYCIWNKYLVIYSVNSFPMFGYLIIALAVALASVEAHRHSYYLPGVAPQTYKASEPVRYLYNLV